MDHKSIKTYLQFIIYFIIFGIAIAIITSIINYKNKFNDINHVIHKSAAIALSAKQETIKRYIYNIQKDINALESNEILKRYLHNQSDQNLKELQNLFILISDATDQYFQVRLLSNTGKELIRVDKNRNLNEPILVDNTKLQDKSHRYYYKETIKLPPNTFWYSKLDLNIENKKIEYPLRPTYRIAKPIYHNNKPMGIIIFNIDMNYVTKQLQKTANFDFYLIDSDGYFLTDSKGKYSWSRYLNGKYTFNKIYPQAFELIKESKFNDKVFHSVSIEYLLQNNENIKMILKTDQKYISNLINSNYKLALYLGITILLISIPIGMIIAITPTKIQKKLKSTLSKNKKYLSIIDKYVIAISADLKGDITNVSSATCDISEYKKDELIGKNLSIFKSALIPPSLYKQLWLTIRTGENWTGEIQIKTKNNKHIWLQVDILPQYNEDNKLFGYTSIAQNITNKKDLEKISEHDSLTQIYNRLKIDKVLEYEKNISQRNNEVFSIIFIDIDNFKIINDKYGHLIGDNVLIEFAKILQKNIRSTDIVGRWGGEEFMVICPNTNSKGTIQLAENLRKHIEFFQFSDVRNITASFGISTYNNHEGIKNLILYADKALYRAKESGRNCVKTHLDFLQDK